MSEKHIHNSGSTVVQARIKYPGECVCVLPDILSAFLFFAVLSIKGFFTFAGTGVNTGGYIMQNAL